MLYINTHVKIQGHIKMTLIELFDKSAIDNVAPALCCRPDRIIYIGDNSKLMEKRTKIYKEIFAKKGMRTEVYFKSLPKTKLDVVVEYFSKIVEKYGDCVFDLTGGAEIYLVAVGVILEKYKEKVQCHRYNVLNEKLIDTDTDGKICATHKVSLAVEENVRIYGGEVKRGSDEFSTYSWGFTDELKGDVFSCWEICKKDAKRWNVLIGALGEMCCESLSASPSVLVPVSVAITVASKWRVSYNEILSLLLDFRKKGFVKNLSVEENIAFEFKDENTKRLISVAGQVLELVVAFKMREILDENGRPLYDDVKVGVVVDWDADGEEDRAGEKATINEIDVFAMKGALPIFVSCKNGNFDNEEIYKLHSVASRFGFDYGAKAIVASEFEKIGNRKVLEARAVDMGIKILKNVDEIDDGEWERLLRALWSEQ